MSDGEVGTEGKSSAWTEAAKFQLLLRIVAQLREDGKSINWTKVNMPGRTTKSLQNMWTKINKDILSLVEEGETPETPSKKPAATRKSFASAMNRGSCTDICDSSQAWQRSLSDMISR